MEPFDPAAVPRRRYHHRVWDSARWEGFAFRPDDIVVCTPYKAGTTWMQMICALLVFQRTTFHRPLAEISYWMELVAAPAETLHAEFAAQTHRRIIKSHTPLDGLPYHPDVTYVVVQRDPRDVFMSTLNHRTNFNPEAGRYFEDREMTEGPPPPPPEDIPASLDFWLTRGSFPWERDGAPFWSVYSHAQSFWQHRDRPNIHLFHYADLLEDLDREMRRAAEILGIGVAPSLWRDLVDAAGFASMKANADRVAPDTNFGMWSDNARFFNRGGSGQWRGVLNAADLERFDALAGHYPADMVGWLMRG